MRMVLFFGIRQGIRIGLATPEAKRIINGASSLSGNSLDNARLPHQRVEGPDA